VIATDVGGLAEVVRNNETGLIIEPKNPSAIAKAVIDFYEKGLEEKFTINAKEEKKKYTWEKFVDSVKELIKK